MFQFIFFIPGTAGGDARCGQIFLSFSFFFRLQTFFWSRLFLYILFLLFILDSLSSMKMDPNPSSSILVLCCIEFDHPASSVLKKVLFVPAHTDATIPKYSQRRHQCFCYVDLHHTQPTPSFPTILHARSLRIILLFFQHQGKQMTWVVCFWFQHRHAQWFYSML